METNGYEIDGKWEAACKGSVAKATCGGKQYFLKKYDIYKKPVKSSATSGKLYAEKEKKFHNFVNNRKRINETIAKVAGEGGNIIFPTKWFIDGNCFVEATEFVGGVLTEKEIASLSKEEKLMLMMTASGALSVIHRQGIVHGDLKQSNILVARNSSGRVVAKLIDFDSSYFLDNISDEELSGDQKYAAPELMYCFITDMSEDALDMLSEKADIFSLGLVFYNYLTGGKFPEKRGLSGALAEKAEKGGTVYCGEVLLNGGQLEISSKILDKYLACLITNMLQPEAEKRPTAKEVLDVLKNKKVLPLPKESSVVIVDYVVDKEPSEEIEEHVTDYGEPWDIHKIVLDKEAMKRGGYVGLRRTERSGAKVYQLYRDSGAKRTFSVHSLLALGFASEEGLSKRKDGSMEHPVAELVISDDDTLWASDSDFKYDIDAVHSAGYRGVAKAERNGVKGYALIKTNGKHLFIKFAELKALDMIKRI